MISINSYKSSLLAHDAKKYVGVYWPDGEEKMITDEVFCKHLMPSGKLGESNIFITIRWYNFCYSLWKIIKNKKVEIVTINTVNDAISYAKQNCFDSLGNPIHMAKKLGFSSYSKLLKMIEEDFKAIDEQIEKMKKAIPQSPNPKSL